jgi:hypothetical protein
MKLYLACAREWVGEKRYHRYTVLLHLACVREWLVQRLYNHAVCTLLTTRDMLEP